MRDGADFLHNAANLVNQITLLLARLAAFSNYGGKLRNSPSRRLITCSAAWMRALPWLTCALDTSISARISFAASAQRCAKERTSPATTENPLPSGPAVCKNGIDGVFRPYHHGRLTPDPLPNLRRDAGDVAQQLISQHRIAADLTNGPAKRLQCARQGLRPHAAVRHAIDMEIDCAVLCTGHTRYHLLQLARLYGITLQPHSDIGKPHSRGSITRSAR